jgi:hypothetical protein
LAYPNYQTRIDEAVSRDSEMKAIEKVLAKRILDKLRGTTTPNY